MAMATNCDPMKNAAWYALHTRHQHEKAVAEYLTKSGFETFLPLYSSVHRWKDRNKVVSLPLFPCYVFLHGGLDRKLDVLKAPGVLGIVGCAGHPGNVPESEIAGIRRAVESSLHVEPHPFLHCGDRVRIKAGPLCGLEGILVRKASLFRVVLSIEMLARSVAVEVESSVVDRIGHRHHERPRSLASPVHQSS